MIVGFTGTQMGCSEKQLKAVEQFINDNISNIIGIHHGDCIGADAEFHELCIRLGLGFLITIHPPINESKRAFCKGARYISVEKDYLTRNHDIADASCTLLACPKTSYEEVHSGTWATIRYARKTGKEVNVFFPEGEENGT